MRGNRASGEFLLTAFETSRRGTTYSRNRRLIYTRQFSYSRCKLDVKFTGNRIREILSSVLLTFAGLDKAMNFDLLERLIDLFLLHLSVFSIWNSDN